MSGKQLAHAYKAKVGKIWRSVCVALGKLSEMQQMIICLKGELDETVFDHLQYQRGITEMKSRLCENGLTSQKRIRDFLRYGDCPIVMCIAPIGKGDQKTCVGDCLHAFEKPLR